MAGFLQNFINGNPNRPEFTPDMLPKNRFQLFWEMFKLNWWNLLKVNFFYMWFTIPMWANIFIHVQILVNMASESELGLTTESVLPFFNDGYFSLFLIIMIPCLILQGPAKAALKYITRNWARDDYAAAWGDFWYAFKLNWKQGLAHGIINAALFGLGVFAVYFYSIMSGTNTMFSLLQIVMIVLGVLFYCINIYSWPMLVTYDMGLRDIFKNSMVLAIGRLPLTLIYFVLTALPAVICFLFPVCTLYYFVIGYSLHAFINVSYTNGAFDKYINVNLEGAEVNKGLYVPPVEEDEYEYVDIDDFDDDEFEEEDTKGKKKDRS